MEWSVWKVLSIYYAKSFNLLQVRKLKNDFSLSHKATEEIVYTRVSHGLPYGSVVQNPPVMQEMQEMLA